MSLVKTLSELTLERMNTCTESLAKKYLNSVKAIYGATENGKPEHIGSCVLIEHNGTKYLITAAHVIDTNKHTSLYISGESKLVQITGQCLITAAPNEDRNQDKLDFSILQIPDKISTEIGNVEYLSEREWHLDDLPNNERCCLVIGFPNSRNKRIDPAKNAVRQEPFVYASTIKSEVGLFSSTGGSPENHFLLNFCSKHSKDSSNKTINSIHPRGVSGGGLFLIEGMANPQNYQLDAECKGKLIGILIAFHKNQKVLMFTKLSLIILALTSPSSGRRTGAA